MFNLAERLVVELCKREIKLPLVQNLLNNDRLVAYRALKIARAHNLAALFLDRLMQLPIDFAGKNRLIPVAREEILRVTCTNLAFRRELRRINTVLTANGLDCVLLKGLSLDFEGLRTIGDLDILVAQNMIVQAINSILAIPGYRFRLKRDMHDLGGRLISGQLSARNAHKVLGQVLWNSEYQLYYGELGILVELHTHLLQAPPDGYSSGSKELATFQQNVQYFWDRKVVDPLLNCFTLSPEHLLILLCLHAAFKRYPANNTFRLSNLLDIDRLAARGVDWEEVVQTCRSLKVPHMVRFSLRLAQRLLDTPVSESTLAELEADLLWSRRLAGDLHLKSMRSLAQSSSVSSKLYIILTNLSSSETLWERIRWALIIPILFPSRWRMASLFGISQTSLLLPFVYIMNPVRWIWLIVRRLLRK
jgi:hypothetical protein